MPKSSSLDNSILKLIFNGTPIANIADNTLTSPLTNLYVSLHTSDPGVGGTQSTNEAAYTGYSRVAVARTTGGFTVTGASVSPVAAVNFGVCTASPGSVITFAAIGTLSSGAGIILYSGLISGSIPMAIGVQPQITTASLITES
jgi:hypothetical protein